MADPVADIRATADATGDHGGESSVAATHPVAVKGGATISVTVVLLTLLVASVAVFLVSSPPHRHDAGHGGGGGDKRAEEERRAGEPIERAVGDAGVVPPGWNSRLDAFRTWARLAWMKLRRPPLSQDPAASSGYEAGTGTGSAAAGSVEGAAKKSFEMGKETAEQAAATAAKVAGATLGKAKENAKQEAAAAADED